MKLEPTTPTTAMLLELGRRLATVRAQQGLTQQQLAEQALQGAVRSAMNGAAQALQRSGGGR